SRKVPLSGVVTVVNKKNQSLIEALRQFRFQQWGETKRNDGVDRWLSAYADVGGARDPTVVLVAFQEGNIVAYATAELIPGQTSNNRRCLIEHGYNAPSLQVESVHKAFFH